MSFINKETQVVIQTKLTAVGRELLANGKLTFKKFAVGDSEIDYNFTSKYGIDPTDLRILKPVDFNPQIKHYIKPTVASTDFRVALGSVDTNPTEVTTTTVKGFFSGTTANNQMNLSTDYVLGTTRVVGTSVLGTATVQLEDTLDAVQAGCYALVGWNSEAGTGESNEIGLVQSGTPKQYLWYKVVAISGTTLELDRNVPSLSTAIDSEIIFFPAGDSMKTFYSTPAEREASPVWAFTIVYSKTMEGALDSFRASQYPSAVYNGFKRYLSTIPDKALGIVHYTNFNVDNLYGETLVGTGFTVDLPTIMYHNNPAATLGLKLKGYGAEKNFIPAGATSGFSTPYVDLVDAKLKIVGKVFTDYKLATIEDQEILAAMSFNSNRNWTLPDFNYLNCVAAEQGEDLYVTYQLVGDAEVDPQSSTSSGFLSAIHSQNLHKFDCAEINYIDFKFNPAEFMFMKGTPDGLGFSAKKLLVLMQRVPRGTKPVHSAWLMFDATELIGATGFIQPAQLGATTYRLTETDFIHISDYGLIYDLDYLRPYQTANNQTEPADGNDGTGDGGESEMPADIGGDLPYDEGGYVLPDDNYEDIPEIPAADSYTDDTVAGWPENFKVLFPITLSGGTHYVTFLNDTQELNVYNEEMSLLDTYSDRVEHEYIGDTFTEAISGGGDGIFTGINTFPFAVSTGRMVVEIITACVDERPQITVNLSSSDDTYATVDLMSGATVISGSQKDLSATWVFDALDAPASYTVAITPSTSSVQSFEINVESCVAAVLTATYCASATCVGNSTTYESCITISNDSEGPYAGWTQLQLDNEAEIQATNAVNAEYDAGCVQNVGTSGYTFDCGNGVTIVESRTYSSFTMTVAQLQASAYTESYNAAIAKSEAGFCDLQRGYSNLYWGEESFLLGNVSATSVAVVYRTKFIAQLGVGNFATSTNPTWDSSLPVYISEIGIYDDLNNLVAIGKLSTPIRKASNNMVVLSVDMDF